MHAALTPAQKRAATRQGRIDAAVRAMHECCRGQTPETRHVSRGFRVLQDLWCATVAPTAKNKYSLRESARLCIAHGCEPRA